jgi:chemotaxis family two-component system response regulator Rcp1
MSPELFTNDTCPKCYKPVKVACVERHPTRRDLTHHNFRCAGCGYVKTKVVSLKVGALSPENAVYATRKFDGARLNDQPKVRPLFAKADTPMAILLVEDSPGDIRLTLEAFSDANPSVSLYVVNDGTEAMEFLRREGSQVDAPRPELILLDLSLPKMDGREVLALIKNDENLKLIPTLILTTSAAEADFVVSYQFQANCYLQKPIRMDVFEDVVKAINDFWLANARLPQLALVA